MGKFKKNIFFDYNNDGETSLTEYIIGEKTIEDSNKLVDVSMFNDEEDFNIFDSDGEEDDF